MARWMSSRMLNFPQGAQALLASAIVIQCPHVLAAQADICISPSRAATATPAWRCGSRAMRPSCWRARSPPPRGLLCTAEVLPLKCQGGVIDLGTGLLTADDYRANAELVRAAAQAELKT